MSILIKQSIEFAEYCSVVRNDLEHKRDSLVRVYSVFYSEMNDLIANGKKKIPKRRMDERFQPTDGIEVLIGYDYKLALDSYSNDDIQSAVIMKDEDVFAENECVFDGNEDFFSNIQWFGMLNTISHLGWESDFVIDDALNLNNSLIQTKRNKVKSLVKIILNGNLCNDVINVILEFY